MPAVQVPGADLVAWGKRWTKKSSFTKKQSQDFGHVFDAAVGKALAAHLGGIHVVEPSRKRSESLLPSSSNVVEVGPVRVIGGVRPQYFDVVYRPDGVRFAFDSKTLNSRTSVKKNWQNMINDLATEATTVHTRFPFAVVAFMVVCPVPSVAAPQLKALIETLERLGRRERTSDLPHLAEALSLTLWDPATGAVDPAVPATTSPLRIEKFSDAIDRSYRERYKGLPPHE